MVCFSGRENGARAPLSLAASEASHNTQWHAQRHGFDDDVTNKPRLPKKDKKHVFLPPKITI
ncbi:MAG: hypothetical protein U5L45_20575 [Saprospiraceae bacterium]|nr:hypothetical protein [Saprospiraceae bacterium]